MKSSWHKAKRRRKKESLERYLRLQKKQTAPPISKDCSSAHLETETDSPLEDNKQAASQQGKSVKDSRLYREWLKKKKRPGNQQCSAESQQQAGAYHKRPSGSVQYDDRYGASASGRDKQRSSKNISFPLLINVKRRYIKIAVCLVAFLAVLAFSQSDNRLSSGIRQTVAYILTTDFDYQPALDRIASGLQNINISVPTLGGGTQKTAADDKEAGGDSSDAARPAATGTASGTAVGGDGGTVAASALTVGTLPVSGSVGRGYGWLTAELDGLQRFHEGIDIMAAAGSEIKAVADGNVTKIGSDPELGAYLLLQHAGEGNYSLYAQLAEILVQEGQEVTAGTKIGTLGEAIDGSEPHLHFELRENNNLIDPLTKMDIAAV